MNTYRPLRDAELSGKRVLLRAGFDVPIEDGVVTDASRIEALLPTMKHMLDNGASLVILAHQGRPKGKATPEFSQKPLVPVLGKLLGTTVHFSPDVTGPSARKLSEGLKAGEVLLLENLRFDPREEANDEAFAQELAKLGDVYVNDAFTNCHRAHASMVGVPALLPSFMGLQLEEEVTHLSRVTENPVRPLTLIISGAKLETKVPVISRFLEQGDDILTGGAIANTLVAAAGHTVGRSKYDADALNDVRGMLKKSGEGNATVHAPVDAVIASDTSGKDAHTVPVSQVPADCAIFDIGPATVEAYGVVIARSKTIVWNGPLGMYEEEAFSHGSSAIARVLADAASKGATVVIGGGDTIDFHVRYKHDMSTYAFVSTGGGAMLEFVSGKTLPGLEALRRSA